MMHLPLKYASAAPLTAIFLVALGWNLLAVEGREIHPIFGLPNAFGYAFLMTMFGILLVLPNLAAAILANRFGESPALFVAVLGGLGIAFCLATNLVFDRWLIGGLFEFGDWRLYAVALANAAVLLLAAVLSGERHA